MATLLLKRQLPERDAITDKKYIQKLQKHWLMPCKSPICIFAFLREFHFHIEIVF